MSEYNRNVEIWKAEMGNKGWIGVDLDGTLAEYTGWSGPLVIGAPIPKMVERIKKLLADGKTVKVFTARVSEPDEDVRAAIIALIGDWTEKHVGQRLEVTNVKTYQMIECYDDRIKQVVPNTGVTLEEELHEIRDLFQKLVKRVGKILNP